MKTHVAADPYARKGEVLDTGHCMRHCQIVAGVPHSSHLRRGPKVLGGHVPRGTAIATFGPNGTYTNSVDGSSHIALLVEETKEGSLLVVDAWVGKAVGERVIRNKHGVGPAVDDASRYYVVHSEVA